MQANHLQASVTKWLSKTRRLAAQNPSERSANGNNVFFSFKFEWYSKHVPSTFTNPELYDVEFPRLLERAGAIQASVGRTKHAIHLGKSAKRPVQPIFRATTENVPSLIEGMFELQLLLRIVNSLESASSEALSDSRPQVQPGSDDLPPPIALEKDGKTVNLYLKYSYGGYYYREGVVRKNGTTKEDVLELSHEFLTKVTDERIWKEAGQGEVPLHLMRYYDRKGEAIYWVLLE